MQLTGQTERKNIKSRKIKIFVQVLGYFQGNTGTECQATMMELHHVWQGPKYNSGVLLQNFITCTHLAYALFTNPSSYSREFVHPGYLLTYS